MLLYSPKSVYALDQAAIEQDHLSGIELMGRAGERVWNAIIERWPDLSCISIFAGAGNNGGDAFVVALLAEERGVEVQMLVQGDLEGQSETSRHYRELWQQAGGVHQTWAAQPIRGDVIVDGLLGIGLQRELDQHWQQLIGAINACDAPRVAIDIPSGLNAATGMAQPLALQADLTVTFIGRKPGQYLADGPDYCGELIYADLGVSSQTLAGVNAALRVIEACDLPPLRKKNSHKNRYGNLLVVGGDQGMSGAVALAARAALRSGAGLVTALVHPDCRASLGASPEVMVQSWDALEDKLKQASVLLVGPGLGNNKAAERCLELLARVELPIVVDASALQSDFLQRLQSDQCVITPHPGEAAALLSCDTAAIQSDRLAACAALQTNFDATTVLKGSGTLIAAAGETTAINTRGNPGMASAGMGDVLGGIIAALLGQGMSPFAAARTGVYIHALCAEDYCEDNDQIGLIASDIIERIPRVIKCIRDAR